MTKKSPWTIELQDQLLSLWKKHANIYDTNDADYKDKDKKLHSFRRIAKKIKKMDDTIDVESIKKKMAQMRACYTKELGNIQQALTEDRTFVPKLRYFNQMDFLRDFCTTRAKPNVSKIDGDANETSTFKKMLTDEQKNDEEETRYEFNASSEDEVHVRNHNESSEKDDESICEYKKNFVEPSETYCNGTVNSTMLTAEKSLDDHTIFANYIASEFRLLKSDSSRQLLRRKIQKAILEVADIDESNEQFSNSAKRLKH